MFCEAIAEERQQYLESRFVDLSEPHGRAILDMSSGCPASHVQNSRGFLEHVEGELSEMEETT